MPAESTLTRIHQVAKAEFLEKDFAEPPYGTSSNPWE